jgi:glycosyltransferase involved in cell wall biosynthesis
MTIEKCPFAIPRVSVLMTVYNAALYVRQSIDSILNQSFKDWELIAVDDGSTDASLSILKDYSDHRIRVLPLSKNIGRTPALRYAFDQARGEYIAVLDNDDISHPERLARQVVFLDEKPDVAIAGSWVQYIDQHGMIFAEFSPPTKQDELYDCLGWINPIVHSSAMFRRSLAIAVGGYPEHLAYSQDFGLVLKLAHHYKIAVIDEFLCQLRILPNSFTRSKKKQAVVAHDLLTSFRFAGNFLPLSKKARRLNRRALAMAKIKLGVATFGAGSILAGLQMILTGIVHDPSSLWNNNPVNSFLGRSSVFLKKPPHGLLEIR